MNVHDFNGVIELAENLVGFNVAFIPEYKQWYQPSEKHGIGMGLQELPNFLSNVTTSANLDYWWNTVREYRVGMCSEWDGRLQDRNLFEAVLNQDLDI
jgi:hypothetical protein